MTDPHASDTPQQSAVSDSGRSADSAPRLHRPAKTRSVGRDTDLTRVARELAIQSRRAQGLPGQVADPAALAHGADLVLALRRRTERPRTGTPP